MIKKKLLAFLIVLGTFLGGVTTLSLVSAAPAYVPPIGIPAPPFGVNEVAGAFTHYVDNTSSASTDINNPNGSVAKPRKTVPTTLAAGSVVEVHGGPYTDLDAHNPVQANGTAAAPVFIRGVGKPLFKSTTSATYDGQLILAGSYAIMEGVVVGDSDLSFSFNGHHLVLRDSEVRNVKPPGNSAAVYSMASGAAGAYDVVLRCHIHHNGNYLSPIEADVHGVKVSEGASFFWVLDSELDHNGGQSMQVGDDTIPNTANWPHHIYYGRNVSHEDRECGYGMKQAKDVILSQNEFWGYKVPPDASNSAGGIALARNGSQWVWAIFNKVHDSNGGIRFNGNDDQPGGPVYIVGNLLYNLKSATGCGSNPSCFDEASTVGFNNGSLDAFIVDNTIVNTEMCFKHNNTIRRLEMSGNVCQNASSTQAQLSTNSNGGTIFGDYLLLPPSAKIMWEDYNQISLTQLKAQGKCLHCKEGNAFLDSNFRPSAGSPAIDAGTRHAAYDVFKTRYGISIDVDFDGKARPQGGGWDIGAFESGSGPVPTPTPTPTPVPTPTPTPTPVPTPTPTPVPTPTPTPVPTPSPCPTPKPLAVISTTLNPDGSLTIVVK